MSFRDIFTSVMKKIKPMKNADVDYKKADINYSKEKIKYKKSTGF